MMGITTSIVKGLGSTLTTLLPIGALALGAYLVIKNAGFIGSSVGGFAGTGLRNLGSGISEGFATTFDIFGGSPNPNTGGAISQDDPNTIVTDSPMQVNDPSMGIVTPNPLEEGFTPIATPFKSFVSAGTLSREFAEAYSFQPPARSGQLDVSKTFAYISSPTYRANQEQAVLSGSNYGGFGTEQAQTNALASAIEDSAKRYPEWFA
jgi:hypothetical protein